MIKVCLVAVIALLLLPVSVVVAQSEFAALSFTVAERPSAAGDDRQAIGKEISVQTRTAALDEAKSANADALGLKGAYTPAVVSDEQLNSLGKGLYIGVLTLQIDAAMVVAAKKDGALVSGKYNLFLKQSGAGAVLYFAVGNNVKFALDATGSSDAKEMGAGLVFSAGEELNHAASSQSAAFSNRTQMSHVMDPLRIRKVYITIRVCDKNGRHCHNCRVWSGVTTSR